MTPSAQSYYLDSFLTNLEYQLRRSYNDFKYYEGKEMTNRSTGEKFMTPDVWAYSCVMVNNVPDAPYYDPHLKTKSKTLSEGDPVILKAKENLHKQIEESGVGEGEVLFIKKVEDGNRTFIKLLNKLPERDVKDAPNDNKVPPREEHRKQTPSQKPSESRGGISPSDARDKSIKFQTCLKCASWLTAPKSLPVTDQVEVTASLARMLYMKLDEFVYDWPVKVKEEEVKEGGLVERLYGLFNLEEGEKGLALEKMINHINGYSETFNDETRHQDKISSAKDLVDDNISEEFFNYVAETRELLNSIGENF